MLKDFNNFSGKRLSNDQFIERVEKICPNRFDFSKLNYVNKNTPVCLIDKEFGNLDLWVIPASLDKGRNIKHPMKTFEEFLFLAEKYHPNEFDFTITKEAFKEIPSEKISKNSQFKVPALCKETNEIFSRSIHWFVTPFALQKRKDKTSKKEKEFETFIEKSHILYGNKFDYSKVVWKNYNTSVEIVCNDCKASIFVVPNKHLKGNTTCKNCGKLYKKEKDLEKKTIEFIERLKILYGDKFDYSYINYINYDTKVKLLCKKHNQFFEEYPRNLLKGREKGCLLCKEELRIEAAKNFIEKAKKIHEDLYDYSLVIDTYKNMTTKVEIICNNCGQHFFQTPTTHIYSQHGCPFCSQKRAASKISEKRLYTTEEFIEKARVIHGNKYDYSEVNYTGINNYVTIICPKHGPFEQKAGNHIHDGAGCFKCYAESRALTTEEFIKRAKEIHRDKYDYSEVHYVNMYTKVKIFCKECQEYFWKIPADHIYNKGGCPNCKDSLGEKRIEKWLENHALPFTLYQKFENLKYINDLDVDLYIESINLGIEYQGIQHFKPVRFGGISEERAQEAFDKQIARDKIKEEYFKNSDINLLCIHYKDYEKIDEILEKVIIEKDYEYLKTTNSYIF